MVMGLEKEQGWIHWVSYLFLLVLLRSGIVHEGMQESIFHGISASIICVDIRKFVHIAKNTL